MKYVSRKILVSLVASLSLLPSVAVVAQGDNSTNGISSSNLICTKLSSFESKVMSKIDEKNNFVGEKRGLRKEKLGANRQSRDSKLAAKRAELDAKRQEHYAKLLEGATNEEQKAAIVAFQAAVEKAVSERRAAFDAAKEAFKSGVDALIASQQSKVDTARAQLKVDVAAAFDKAETSCAADGADAKAIGETLKADLKAAKEKFRSSVKNLADLKSQITELKNTRKAAILQASDDFKKALEEARSALKAVLGGSSSEDSDNSENSTNTTN